MEPPKDHEHATAATQTFSVRRVRWRSANMWRGVALAMIAGLVAAEPADTICVGEGATKACAGNFASPVDPDHNPESAESTCRDWCSQEECKNLSGDLTQECSLCSTAALCNPAAADYEANKQRTQGNALTCREHCEKNTCDLLKGNPHFECGGCSAPYECHPGAPHFDDWDARRLADAKEL
jgi:hypothetical protein